MGITVILLTCSYNSKVRSPLLCINAREQGIRPWLLLMPLVLRNATLTTDRAEELSEFKPSRFKGMSLSTFSQHVVQGV